MVKKNALMMLIKNLKMQKYQVLIYQTKHMFKHLKLLLNVKKINSLY